MNKTIVIDGEEWEVCESLDVENSKNYEYKEVTDDQIKKNVCYNSIKKLTDSGLQQINIHAFISEESYNSVMSLLRDRWIDSRLKGLNAIVLLSLKKKGRGSNYHPLSQEKFNSLVTFALEHKIPIGFDSCTAGKFMAAVKGHVDEEKFETLCEPCESGCFSLYADVKGLYYPCSFIAGTEGWEEGIDGVNTPFHYAWNHPRMVEWRKKLIENKRACPKFQI